jgi:hypothetical protein
MILQEAAAPYTITAGRIEFDRKGNIELFEVRLEGATASDPSISIPYAKGIVDFGDALDGKMLSLRVESPVIAIPLEFGQQPGTLSDVAGIEARVTSVAAAAASPVFALGRLSISDAQLFIGENISGRFDYEADTLAVFDDGTIDARRHKLSVTDAVLEEEGTGPWIDIPSVEAEFSLDRSGSTFLVQRLQAETVSVRLDAPFFAWLDKRFPDADTGAAPVSAPNDPAAPAPVPREFKALLLEQGAIGELAVSIEGFDGMPQISFVSTWESSGAVFPLAGDTFFEEFELAEQVIDLREFSAALPDADEPFLTLSQGSALIERIAGGPVVFRTLAVDDPEVTLTPEVLDFFGDSNDSTDEPDMPAADPKRSLVRIEEGNLQRLLMTVSDFDDGNAKPFLPSFRSWIDLDLAALEIGTGGVHSGEPQRLMLHDVLVTVPRADPEKAVEEIASICHVEVSIVPEQYFADKTVSYCRIESPEIRLGSTFWNALERNYHSALPALDGENPLKDNDVVDIDVAPNWEGLKVSELEVNDGFFRLEQSDPKIANVSGRFAIWTDGESDEGDPVYHGEANDLVFHAPADTTQPIARVASLVVTVDTGTLWSEKSVTSAIVKGAEVEAGDRLYTLFDESEDSTPEPPAVVPEDSESEEVTSEAIAPLRWRVGDLRIEDSIVIVKNVAPLIPSITLPVKASLTDLPLTPEGLYEQDELMKVELSAIRIPSPYGQTAAPVADLDTMFIHFSLAGLMRSEIEKVELLNPTIFVGENLFWYIEFFRREDKRPRTAEQEGIGTESEQTLVATGSEEEEEWNIKTIDVHFGKLIMALTGSIDQGLPEFPFSCSTALENGRLSATLEIPSGLYKPVDSMELEIAVDGGMAEFNLPLKGKDNNLVESFRASELRYKQFVSTEVYLDVTYNQYGVYAHFGGKTYDGYTDGEVNLYIDDDFSWDGWVAGTKVNTKNFTDVLTPEYFQMTGIANFKVIAQGNLGALYQAYGDFYTLEPGVISVPALDELKEKYPDDWTKLEASLTDVGLEALRDLPFAMCQGNFKLFEREGVVSLNADGPSGLRAFKLAVHDYRLPALSKILELAYLEGDAEWSDAPHFQVADHQKSP